MGAYRYLQEIWRKKQSDVMKFLARIRTWEYRQRPPIVRVSRPTRPDKAHRVGYKAKNGFVVYRVKIRRGGRRKNASKGIVYGKPSNSGIYLKHGPNLQALAEQKIGRRLPSLRILNSYWVAQDYVHKYFEVILIDPANKVIRDDPRISWICSKIHREMRGVTGAGKKHRGLTVKGHKANHNRPSRRANTLRHKKVSLRRYR